MSTLSVDSAGNRITTDILIAGYVHDFEREFTLESSIPNEIIGVIFMFWFVDVCDDWDTSLCGEEFDIDGEYAKLIEVGQTYNLYGMKSVRTGSWEWKIKAATNIPFLCVGIIKDDENVLKFHKKKYEYFNKENGLMLACIGCIFFSGTKSINYGAAFGDKDDVIKMKLDMDKKTISFKINDQQYETKDIASSITKYRLAVTVKKFDDREVAISLL